MAGMPSWCVHHLGKASQHNRKTLHLSAAMMPGLNSSFTSLSLSVMKPAHPTSRWCCEDGACAEAGWGETHCTYSHIDPLFSLKGHQFPQQQLLLVPQPWQRKRTGGGGIDHEHQWMPAIPSGPHLSPSLIATS